MSKTINARIAALEFTIKTIASANKCIYKVQAAIGNWLDKVQGKATAAMNTCIDRRVQELLEAASAARDAQYRKLDQLHDQLAELRITFIEDSQLLMYAAKHHMAAAKAKAYVLSDEAAALQARKK